MTQNMKVGLQPIQVKYFNTVNDLGGFQHIVFISSWQSSKINMLMQKISGSSTLVVSENEGMIEKGSMTNFIPVNGTI
ncbi:MAG TPA: YfiR family protein [Bacteroidales bacterium]|nr:YfiR family protein [Bacteroidales bacterium]